MLKARARAGPVARVRARAHILMVRAPGGWQICKQSWAAAEQARAGGRAGARTCQRAGSGCAPCRWLRGGRGGRGGGGRGVITHEGGQLGLYTLQWTAASASRCGLAAGGRMDMIRLAGRHPARRQRPSSVFRCPGCLPAPHQASARVRPAQTGARVALLRTKAPPLGYRLHASFQAAPLWLRAQKPARPLPPPPPSQALTILKHTPVAAVKLNLAVHGPPLGVLQKKVERSQSQQLCYLFCLRACARHMCRGGTPGGGASQLARPPAHVHTSSSGVEGMGGRSSAGMEGLP